MSLSINSINNLSAVYALNSATKAANTASNRLATNTRLNSAADGPADIGISQNMLSQLNGLKQAHANTEGAVNLLATADSGLSGVQNALQSLNTQLLDASNSSNSTEDLANIQASITATLKSLSSISDNTKFGSQKLLDGSFSSKSFQIGANAGDTASVTIQSASSKGFNATDLGLDSIDVTAGGDQSASLQKIADALKTVSTARASIGATSNTFTSQLGYLETATTNMDSSYHGVVDTDVAAESSTLAKSTILQQSAAAMITKNQQTSSNLLLSLLQ